MQHGFEEELLSAYLDNELSAEQRRQVEEQLAMDPQTRHALESLRQVRGLVAKLPGWTGPDLDLSPDRLSEAAARSNSQTVGETTEFPANGNADSHSKQLGGNQPAWLHSRWLNSRSLSALAAGIAVVALAWPYWFGTGAKSELASSDKLQGPEAITLDMPASMNSMPKAIGASSARQASPLETVPTTSAEQGEAVPEAVVTGAVVTGAAVTGAAGTGTAVPKLELPENSLPETTLRSERDQQLVAPAAPSVAMRFSADAVGGPSKPEVTALDEQQLLNLPGLALKPAAPRSPSPAVAGDSLRSLELAASDQTVEPLLREATGGLAGGAAAAAPMVKSSTDARGDAMRSSAAASTQRRETEEYWLLRSTSWTAEEALGQTEGIHAFLKPLNYTEPERVGQAPNRRTVMIGLASLSAAQSASESIKTLQARLPAIPWAESQAVGSADSADPQVVVCLVSLAEARLILSLIQGDSTHGTGVTGNIAGPSQLPPAWWFLPSGGHGLSAQDSLDDSQRVVLVLTVAR